MRSIVLASTSRYRRELLDRLGVPYTVAAPAYEETSLPNTPPNELVRVHAEGKARSLAARFPEALLIGSDQAVALEGRILGKPGTPEHAIEQLRSMQGREHTLWTAVVVLDARSGELGYHVDETRVRMRALGDPEIAGYVARENPVDCAGSYRSEGLGIALFDSLCGNDPTAIVGLPLIALARMLRYTGIEVLTS